MEMLAMRDSLLATGQTDRFRHLNRFKISKFGIQGYAVCEESNIYGSTFKLIWYSHVSIENDFLTLAAEGFVATVHHKK